MDIEKQIHSYIVENFLFGDDESLSASQSLLETGVMDSTGVIELAAYLEKTYEIAVADQDLVPENLDTIANIAAFVQRKQETQTAESRVAE